MCPNMAGHCRLHAGDICICRAAGHVCAVNYHLADCCKEGSFRPYNSTRNILLPNQRFTWQERCSCKGCAMQKPIGGRRIRRNLPKGVCGRAETKQWLCSGCSAERWRPALAQLPTACFTHLQHQGTSSTHLRVCNSICCLPVVPVALLLPVAPEAAASRPGGGCSAATAGAELLEGNEVRPGGRLSRQTVGARVELGARAPNGASSPPQPVRPLL